MPLSIVHALSAEPVTALFSLLAQAPAGTSTGTGGGGATSLVVPGLILVGIYFLIFAPQLKRQKDHQKLVASIQTGDEVVTTGGIFGVVTGVKTDRFVVEIAKGTRIELEKAHVQARSGTPADDKPAAKASTP